MMDSKISSGAAVSAPSYVVVVVTVAVLWLLDIKTGWGDVCYPVKPVEIQNPCF